MKKTIFTILRFVFIAFLTFAALIALVVIYIFTYDMVPRRLSKDQARYNVTEHSSYFVHESARLIYAKKYWPQERGPATTCAVFKLSESDFASFLENNFEKEGTPITERLTGDKGCYEFKKRIGDQKLSLFEEVSRSSVDSTGYALYIDEKNRTLMFEMYL